MTTSSAAQQRGYDLSGFLSSVGGSAIERALSTERLDRPKYDGPVEMLENDIVQVTASPMQVAAYVDGVQNAIAVTHREHRGVYLTWTAAGAVAPGAKPVKMRQRTTIICSAADRQWLEEHSPADRRPPFQELSTTDPEEVTRQAAKRLGEIREGLERELVEYLRGEGVMPVVVDGSLVGRPFDRSLHGVVKTTRRIYLADESVLHRLPVGYRSPIFKLAGGVAHSDHSDDRYSCYLRLHDARTAAWDFALIRLESFDPDALDSLAARALRERQGEGSGDGRYDRHLAAVADTEQVVRSFLPWVFEV